MTDWIKFLHVYLTNKEIFFGFYQIIPKEVFKHSVLANLYILSTKYVEKHKAMPNFDTMEALLIELPDIEQDNIKVYKKTIDQIRNSPWDADVNVIKEQITAVIRSFEFERVILRTADKFATSSPEGMIDDLRGVINKFAPRSTGVDVTDVKRMIEFIRQDHTEKVSTGITDLDNALSGGYGTEELVLFMAPPGRGKSAMLLNAMYYAMLAGNNVLYVTLELSEKAVIRRLYSRVSFSNKSEMQDETMVEKTASRFFTLAKAKGRVIYFPGQTLTVAALESLLQQQEHGLGFKPDILIIDYQDRLAPRQSDMRGEVRHQLRNISDDLRSIAIKYGIPVVSATQANRDSLGKTTISEANVSESFGKVEVADVLLAISSKDEERARNRARLIVIKNRDGVSGASIELYVDFERMYLSDMRRAQNFGMIADPGYPMDHCEETAI